MSVSITFKAAGEEVRAPSGHVWGRLDGAPQQPQWWW